MKHIKEWNTCDRCGEKIKNTLIRKGKMNIKTEVQEGYHASNVLNDFEIILYTKEAQFELCPKCGKEFVRFMKNENNGNE
jgi:predicted RNA-binding Zn-ribbon protein involved in translation (DUF1610 family)